MKVSYQKGGILQAPVVVGDVDAVVIMADDDTPVAAAMSVGGHVWVKTINDSDFKELMESLGLEHLVKPVKAFSVPGAKE